MNVRRKLAVILLAWLVIVPVAVLAPTSEAAALAPEDDALSIIEPAETSEIEFGTRLSRPPVTGTLPLVRMAAIPGGFTVSRLDVPTFTIWPNEDLNQVVNLESFLQITSGYNPKSWCAVWGWFSCLVRANTLPIGARYEFRESATGARHTEDCWGPGMPWLPGMTQASFPWCGRDWDHSSDITGEVRVEARVLSILFLNGIGPIPVKSRAGDAKMLKVGEVLNLGQTVDLASIAIPPTTSTETGICSWWGISIACDAVEVVAEAALEIIYEVFPFLEEVAKFFDGCADAVINAAGGLVDIIRELKDAITDPRAFVDEKLQEFRDLIAAIEEDPVAFARDVLGDLAQVDRLDEEGLANWLGSMICTLAIEYFTGKAADTIISAARTWLRNRRNGPDVPNPNCIFSSFPGDVQVLMADGDTERIDSIQPGDYVLSHNIDTSVWEPKLVVDQWSHLDRGPPATATLANQATITATDDHLFWRSSSSQWVQLQHLHAGDELLTPTGTTTVDHVVVGDSQDWMVWELTVQDNHNFMVLAGDAAVLVHNGRRCPGESEDIQSTNHPDGAATAAEQAAWDRYLERMDAEGTLPLTADEWLARKRDLDAARLAGSVYEQDALRSPEINLPKNTTQIGNDPGFIPDGIKNPPTPPARAELGDPLDMVEVKNVQYLSDTGNVSAMIDHVQEYGGSLELVIGPQTTISGPLRTRLEGIGATVGVLQPNGSVVNVPISEIPGQ